MMSTIYKRQPSHHYVTILVTYGESAIAWDEDDCITYRDRHLVYINSATLFSKMKKYRLR